MLEPKRLIKSIIDKNRHLFAESTFYLETYSFNTFRTNGSLMSEALNWYNNHAEVIKVLKWFGDFWIFIEIKFIGVQTFISLSVFQGKDQDNVKHQLFRAEWDDYTNPDENHSQPHWHITSNRAIEETFEEFSNSFEEDNFINALRDLKSEMIDVNKIHFAMNGNWQNDESHVHVLNDELKIVKWFQGILSHLRVELEYCTS